MRTAFTKKVTACWILRVLARFTFIEEEPSPSLPRNGIYVYDGCRSEGGLQHTIAAVYISRMCPRFVLFESAQSLPVSYQKHKIEIYVWNFKENINWGCLRTRCCWEYLDAGDSNGRLARVIRSRRLRLTGYVGHGRGNQKGKDYLGDLSVDGKIIWKWILKKYGWGMWTRFMWLGIRFSGGLLWTRYWTFRSLSTGNFMTGWATIGFWKSTLLIGINGDN
jgi:hypothetical protein